MLASQVSGTASVARERGASAAAPVQTAGSSSLGANFVFDPCGGARR